MKRQVLPLALVCLLASPCAMAQSGPLDHAEILGRLAQGYWPSYIAHLVKTRGVNFSSSAGFIEGVKLAGGDGVLVQRLFAIDASEQSQSISGTEPSYEHLANCAQLIHEGGIEQAEQECRASIDENPRSAWPLLATANALQLEHSRQGSSETSQKKQEEEAELLRRAVVLAPNVASIHQDLASVLPRAGDAMAELQKASSPDADNLEAYERGASDLSRGFFGGRDSFDEPAESSNTPANIAPELQRRIGIEPDLATNHLALAFLYTQVRNFEKAESELQEALRLEPDNPALHTSLAGYYLYRKNQEACLAELRENVRIVPLAVEPRLFLAAVMEHLGRTPEAINELQSLLRSNPAAIEPSDGLIEIYLEQKDRKSAIAELRRSLKASSLTFANEAEFVQARYQGEDRLANLLKEDRQLDAAAEQYLYLLRFNQDNAGLHNDYGNVLLDERKLDEAIGEYNESLRLDPEQATPHHNIGLALSFKKDLDGAIADYRQALELNPDEPHTQMFLGAVLGQRGDLSCAKDQFQQAMAKNPNDPATHEQLASAMMQFKDESGAIVELKMAIELQPNYAEAENNLAWLYATADDHKLRNPAEALSLAKQAVKDSPQPNAAYIDTLAEALLLNGQPAEALTTEDQASELDPQNPEMPPRLAHFREAAQKPAQQTASCKP